MQPLATITVAARCCAGCSVVSVQCGWREAGAGDGRTAENVTSALVEWPARRRCDGV